MVLEYYYDLLSQPCRAVWLFLKATGVDFEPKALSLLKREHYEPEFEKKNPFHKVPLIDDNGFVLAESAAIMRYLAVKYDVADNWYPRTTPEQHAKVDEFLNWQHLNIRKPEVVIVLESLLSKISFSERFAKKPLDEAKVKAAKEELAKSMKHIDEYFLGDTPYICGQDISAADIMAVSELIQLRCVKEEAVFECNPKVKAWVERVANRLEPYFDEANVILKAVGKRFSDACAEDDSTNL